MDLQADRKRKADEDFGESGRCIRPDDDVRATKRDREKDEQMDLNAIHKPERELARLHGVRAVHDSTRGILCIHGGNDEWLVD